MLLASSWWAVAWLGSLRPPRQQTVLAGRFVPVLCICEAVCGVGRVGLDKKQLLNGGDARRRLSASAVAPVLRPAWLPGWSLERAGSSSSPAPSSVIIVGPFNSKRWTLSTTHATNTTSTQALRRYHCQDPALSTPRRSKGTYKQVTSQKQDTRASHTLSCGACGNTPTGLSMTDFPPKKEHTGVERENQRQACACCLSSIQRASPCLPCCFSVATTPWGGQFSTRCCHLHPTRPQLHSLPSQQETTTQILPGVRRRPCFSLTIDPFPFHT